MPWFSAAVHRTNALLAQNDDRTQTLEQRKPPMRTTNVRLQQRIIGVLALTMAQSSMVGMAAAAEAAGQYFQVGCARCFTPQGKLQPQSLVSLQVDLGTRENCESRLALIPKTRETTEAGLELWCSSESATNQLKFYGVFRNRLTGKSLLFESDSIELCMSGVEVMTGGQAPSNKIEVTTACQAR